MDADLVEGTITMAMQLQRVAGELRHDETKTDDSTRVVALPQPCVRALGRHRVQQAADRLAAGDRWTESDLVFTTRKDTPIEPRNINRTFDALVKRAGVQRIRFHDLRHSCATLLGPRVVAAPRVGLEPTIRRCCTAVRAGSHHPVDLGARDHPLPWLLSEFAVNQERWLSKLAHRGVEDLADKLFDLCPGAG